MEAAAQLTPGAVQAIAGGATPAAIQPVLQVLEVRRFTTAKSGTERYRLMLSDGAHAHQGILSTAFNPLARDGGGLRAGTVVHLTDFMCNTIQDKKIIIAMNLEILQNDCAIIGNPKTFVAQIPAEVQDPNLSSTAAQITSRINTGGLGILGSSVAPTTDQASNNLTVGGSYNGAQGMVGSSIGQKVEPAHNNVFTGVSYGTLPAQNTVNSNMSRPRLQQHSLNSHQNQRVAVPATVGGLSPSGSTHGCPEQPSYQQPPPGYINRGPVGRNESTVSVIPISAIHQYRYERWTIKARVTGKTSVKNWNKTSGSGKFFSFDLLDAQGGEIRAKCFGEAVDRFYDLIEVDKVYLISRGTLKPAQKKFSSLNNDYELSLHASTSSVEVCSSDDYSIPRQQYSFRQIIEIETMDNNTMVDLLGVVTCTGPSDTIIRKDGTETQKRTLQLKDMSGRSIQVTLWGSFCDVEGQQLQLECDSGLNPILALRGGRVNDFSGRSVGTISSTQLKINPDFPAAEKLRQWYMTEGKTAASVSLSREPSNSVRADVRKTIAQIRDESLGHDKPEWITVKAAISRVKTEAFWYPSCPLIFTERPCNKKAIKNADGMWHCERCDKSFESCEYRYAVTFEILDHTGAIYVTAFQEAGEQIFGRPAQELHSVRDVDNDDVLFGEIVEAARWRMCLFKLRVREETFNDEARVKCSVVKAEKLDPSEESRTLLRAINSLLQNISSGPSPGMQGITDEPNTGLTDLPGGHRELTSNDGYAMSMSGGNQFGQQGSIGGGIQARSGCGSSGHVAQNWPADMGGQRPSAGGGFTGINHGPTDGNARSGPTGSQHHQSYGISAAGAPGGFPGGGNYGSTAGGTARSGSCFKCNQPGHWSRDCPGR